MPGGKCLYAPDYPYSSNTVKGQMLVMAGFGPSVVYVTNYFGFTSNPTFSNNPPYNPASSFPTISVSTTGGPTENLSADVSSFSTGFTASASSNIAFTEYLSSNVYAEEIYFSNFPGTPKKVYYPYYPGNQDTEYWIDNYYPCSNDQFN